MQVSKEIKILWRVKNKMVYKLKIQKCPYRTPNNRRCVHKGGTTNCMFINKEEMCFFYNEWVEMRKSKIEPINPPKNAIPVEIGEK